MLAVAFIVTEQEQLVFLDGTAQSAAEHIALKLRNRALIEEVARVQVAIAEELIDAPAHLVGAGGGDDADLRPWTLSVFSPVGVRDNVELPHRVYAQKLSAGPARR